MTYDNVSYLQITAVSLAHPSLSGKIKNNSIDRPEKLRRFGIKVFDIVPGYPVTTEREDKTVFVIVKVYSPSLNSEFTLEIPSTEQIEIG